MSAAGPDELDHVLFPAIARLAAGLLERHAQQDPPADAALIWEVADLLAPRRVLRALRFRPGESSRDCPKHDGLWLPSQVRLICVSYWCARRGLQNG